MATLVISDLHLGSRSGRDVLRRPVPRARLVAALAGVDRLVLLGDTVELLEARPEQALPIALGPLRALGEALGPGREVVVVPGNHDRPLIEAWLHTPGRRLGLDTPVPRDASPLLAELTGALAPARVSVRYPGVWLADEVWATHGHYLDRHLLPAAAYGVARGALGRLPSDGAAPEDYEQALSVTGVEGRLARRLPVALATTLDDLAVAVRRAVVAGPPRSVLPEGAAAARLRSRVLGFQMRRAGIPALARVAHRLGADARARTVVFGHVHRVGPLPGDDPLQWTGPDGRLSIVNTGSWIHEHLLLHRADPAHVYWPGGAVRVERDGTVRVLRLLGDVPEDALR